MNTPSLKGIRVIAFTWVWAGPWMGGVLADMGAEVIKIETRQRLDSQRVVKITKNPEQVPIRGSSMSRIGVLRALP